MPLLDSTEFAIVVCSTGVTPSELLFAVIRLSVTLVLPVGRYNDTRA